MLGITLSSLSLVSMTFLPLAMAIKATSLCSTCLEICCNPWLLANMEALNIELIDGSPIGCLQRVIMIIKYGTMRAKAFGRRWEFITKLGGVQPQGWIGSSSCGPFRDLHIRSNETYGPFANEAEFNDFRMGCFANFAYSENPVTKERLARIGREMPVASDIVFTHGDITRRNLLVDDNAKVVSIIDWEQAGWRAAYWEKVKICFGGNTSSG
ncbi:hypothetical protein F5879DRAFT_1018906 [Lentinula edodes]|nr:hypothetical protein F5879DRAFT_1018906 [Lentinula edodes]